MLASSASDIEGGNNASNNERAARVGFAQGRVVWFGSEGDWIKDWIFYLENEHTLLSMWRGHALHPFERFDRGMYFVCVLCFSFFMSAYVQANYPMHDGFFRYCGWLILASILLVVYDYTLRFLATSPCMQPGGSFHDTCWTCCRDCFVDCGRQGLYVCAAGSTGFLIAGIILAATSEHVLPETFFTTFIAMKLLSYFGEILPLAYFFYTYRELQRQFWLDGVAGGPYPLGPSFPDPLFIRETRYDGETHKWPDPETLEMTNPIRLNPGGTQPPTDPAKRQADRIRRERQIELLRRAREQAQHHSRRSDGTRSPDALEHLGAR